MKSIQDMTQTLFGVSVWFINSNVQFPSQFFSLQGIAGFTITQVSDDEG